METNHDRTATGVAPYRAAMTPWSVEPTGREAEWFRACTWVSTERASIWWTTIRELRFPVGDSHVTLGEAWRVPHVAGLWAFAPADGGPWVRVHGPRAARHGLFALARRCRHHGPTMAPRAAEGRAWEGTWWDCAAPGCGSALLAPSEALRAFLDQRAAE